MAKKWMAVFSSLFLVLILMLLTGFFTQLALEPVVGHHIAIPYLELAGFFPASSHATLSGRVYRPEGFQKTVAKFPLFARYLNEGFVELSEIEQSHYLFRPKGTKERGYGLLTDLRFPDQASASLQFQTWLEQSKARAEEYPETLTEYYTPYDIALSGVPNIKVFLPWETAPDRGYFSDVYWEDDANTPLANRIVWFQGNRMLILSTDVEGKWDRDALYEEFMAYCQKVPEEFDPGRIGEEQERLEASGTGGTF
ncbi:MAG: hypothetical protein ACOX6U_00085 [Oscillospiraceae bacterium]